MLDRWNHRSHDLSPEAGMLWLWPVATFAGVTLLLPRRRNLSSRQWAVGPFPKVRAMFSCGFKRPWGKSTLELEAKAEMLEGL